MAWLKSAFVRGEYPFAMLIFCSRELHPKKDNSTTWHNNVGEYSLPFRI